MNIISIHLYIWNLTEDIETSQSYNFDKKFENILKVSLMSKKVDIKLNEIFLTKMKTTGTTAIKSIKKFLKIKI